MLNEIKVTYEVQIFNVRNYIVENAKVITLAKMRGRYEVGDIFNVYTANDRKFGCEWDGISIATNIEKLEVVLIKDNLI